VARPTDGRIEERYQGLGARVIVPGSTTAWDVSMIEFVLGAHRLIPPHAHRSEDEISYVLEGEVGFRVGDQTTLATPGTVVYKPRGVSHTFWNASDRGVRLLEIIVPAGMEASFRVTPDPGDAGAPARESNVHSDEWVAHLKERYGLKLLGED
jgi:uncharacterized cupin superfamily protein